jgi:hypothetical protein
VTVRHGGNASATAPWLILANVHLGHKVVHFEQAVALRSALRDYRRHFSDSPNYLGTVIAGDFNAVRYRPLDGVSDAAMVPWEIHVAGQFDFRPSAEAHGALLSALWTLNDDAGYKPWTSIQDPAEARLRITEAAEKLFTLQHEAPADWPALLDGLSVAVGRNRIRLLADLSTAASVPERIDFIIAEPALQVADACVVYPENTFASNTGTSDHPAMFVTYDT